MGAHFSLPRIPPKGRSVLRAWVLQVGSIGSKFDRGKVSAVTSLWDRVVTRRRHRCWLSAYSSRLHGPQASFG